MEENFLEHLDYNLNYLTQMFKKVKFKPIESYVAQRIWHLLNRQDVEMVCQQYVKRKNGYALVDIYFPQIALGIEIDEPHHANRKQKQRDELRAYEIIQRTNIELRYVLCYNKDKSTDDDKFYLPLDILHLQIDNIVTEIRERIEQAENSNTFCPWLSEDTLTADHHRKKGVLRVQDFDSFRTTIAICESFGMTVRTNRRGGKKLNDEYILWWPQHGHRDWSNELSEDGMTIKEHPNGKVKISQKKPFIEKIKRITFFKQENAFGVAYYRFVGVFQMTSIEGDMRTYTKIADEYKLP